MTRRQTARGRRVHDQATGVEWIAGVASMPGYVSGEGEPYRPQALVWMGADGAVLGVTLARPGELLPLVGESLRNTIKQPMYGPPHAPTRVRVASAEIVDALRASHPGLDLVCSPTPEIDEMLALMRETLSEDTAQEQSYLSPEVAAEAMASFFDAAADLYRAQPWKVVPDDQSLLSVTIEQLGVREAVIAVIGQMGQSFGLMLFSSLGDFEAYLQAAELFDGGEAPKLPPHFALNFERGADLAPALRKEIAAHHWQVAGPIAHPWLMAIDEDLVARPPTTHELTMAEAIARALTKTLAANKTLRAAWSGGEPVSRRISVRTHGGDIEVSLRAPLELAPVGDAGKASKGHAGTPKPLAYTNGKGVTYYLHEGRTQSGKPRYFFARSVRDGSLAELPTGFEVAESVNGVVSVRRRREGDTGR